MSTRLRTPTKRVKRVAAVCYTIPDGAGGTMRVQLGQPPTERTIAALQELARMTRKAADERGMMGISPVFSAFLRRNLGENV